VVAASGCAQALRVLRSPNETIRLVLLDLSVPPANGGSALREIREIRPGIPVVVTSDLEQTEAMRRFGRQDGAGYLQKPYSGRMLAMRVRAAIGRAAVSGAG
jgi:two-component system cell cycle sensor histidine kinase/response regulator CckA